MSGHSHWAGIKHKKAANDAKRGKLWSKIARIIIVAAKAGGCDPSQNLSLRYAIDKSKQANMPKDTIEKSIKKGIEKDVWVGEDGWVPIHQRFKGRGVLFLSQRILPVVKLSAIHAQQAVVFVGVNPRLE